MAVFAVTNTFVSGASITAAGHNTNWSDVTTWLNNRYNGTDTWSFMKVDSTNANPVDITSSAATTEVSISNSATDGDPLISFELSGIATHTFGVDDSDGDIFKFGTTSLTTNVAAQISTGGLFYQRNFISLSTYTNLSDNVNVSGKLWFNNNSGGALTINGFAGGETGQIILVFNIDALASVTFTNNNAGGTQKILTPGVASLVIGPRGGAVFIFDPAGFWVCLSNTAT